MAQGNTLCALPYKLCAHGNYPVERHYELSWISNTNCKWLQPWETVTSFLIFFIIYQKEPFILDDRERIWYVLRLSGSQLSVVSGPSSAHCIRSYVQSAKRTGLKRERAKARKEKGGHFLLFTLFPPFSPLPARIYEPYFLNNRQRTPLEHKRH